MTGTQLTSLLSGGTNTSMAISMFSVWGLGIVTYLMRRLPSRLWTYFLATFSVSIRMSTSGEGNLAITQTFFNWFMGTKYAKRGRRFSLDASHADKSVSRPIAGIKKSVLSPGVGTHFFFYKKRLGWFTRDKLDNSIDSYSINLHFLGTNMQIVEEFVEDLKPKKKNDQTSVYAIDTSSRTQSGWTLSKFVNKRRLETVILREDIKNLIVNDIKEFYDSAEYYAEKGIRHKRVFIFHGEAGTGKSSLIEALAGYFDNPMYFVNLNAVTDTTFQSCMDKVPENAFILLEDIDVGNATAEREDVESDLNGLTPAAQELEALKKKTETRQKVSMSTVLNTLDGVASLSGNIVILTTNHIEKLDRALIRKGRVDKIVEIPRLADLEIRSYINMMYPDEQIPGEKFDDILGCDIQGYFLDHKKDYQGFMTDLRNHSKENHVGN